MQTLKQELEKIGAGLNAPDQDPMSFTGVRRLRLLYSNNHKDSHSVVSRTHDFGSKKHPTTHRKIHSKSPLKAALMTSDGFISGMSQAGSVAVVVGGVLGLLLISYLIYKYFTWKPKLVARRGYRAVAKSKGISGVEEVVEAKSNSEILRASSSGEVSTK
jgi:hypothetical protein